MRGTRVRFRNWVDRQLSRPERFGTIYELHGQFITNKGRTSFYWIAPDEDPGHLVEVEITYMTPLKTIYELLHEIDVECCKSHAAAIGGIDYVKTLRAWAELISEPYHELAKTHLKELQGHKLNQAATALNEELQRIVDNRKGSNVQNE